MPIRFSRRAASDLGRLSPDIRARMLVKINALEGNPQPSGVRPVKGCPGISRIRLGDIRILFEVDGSDVIIRKIGFRGDVYKRLRHLLE